MSDQDAEADELDLLIDTDIHFPPKATRTVRGVMQCEKCYVFFPRKNWPPTRAGMVAFIGQARLGEQGHLPNRRPVYDIHIPELNQTQATIPLMDGLEE